MKPNKIHCVNCNQDITNDYLKLRHLCKDKRAKWIIPQSNTHKKIGGSK
jgi:hypothetical protein